MKKECVDVLLKIYPTYKLYAKIRKNDFKEFIETRDRKYIIYKFCKNVRNYEIQENKEALSQLKILQRKVQHTGADKKHNNF